MAEAAMGLRGKRLPSPIRGHRLFTGNPALSILLHASLARLTPFDSPPPATLSVYPAPRLRQQIP